MSRIDQLEPALDSTLTLPTDKPGLYTRIFVIDSGVREMHQEFYTGTSTDSRVEVDYGWDFIEKDAVADDCDGHGTHVAGM